MNSLERGMLIDHKVNKREIEDDNKSERIVEEANRLIHKRKSVLRITFGIMAAIAFVFACLLGDLIYATRFKINPVDKSTSPDGTYELSFQQVGDPDCLLDIHMQDMF
ncbi:MAG: hypothetical protein ACOX41_02490 [Anaerovoracaceae bacterium]|jgi:hypothetical protein